MTDGVYVFRGLPKHFFIFVLISEVTLEAIGGSGSKPPIPTWPRPWLDDAAEALSWGGGCCYVSVMLIDLVAISVTSDVMLFTRE